MIERTKGVNKHGKGGTPTYKTLMRQRKEMSSQLSKAFTRQLVLEKRLIDVEFLTFRQRLYFLFTGKIKGVFDD